MTTTVLMIGSVVFATGQTAILPNLVHMRAVFHASVTSLTWTSAGFQVAAAVTAGPLGRLGDMFGKRRLLLVTMGVYAFGAVICLLAPSIGVMIAGRLVMGAGGAVIPLSYSVAREQLKDDDFVRGVAAISATIGSGAAMGLVIGGILSDHATFRWVFALSVAGAVVSMIVIAVYIPQSVERRPARVDAIGVVLLSAGLAVVLIAVSRAPRIGWLSASTLLPIVVGLIVLVAFGAFERRQAYPLIDVPTFLQRPVFLTNAAMFLAGFSFFGGTFIMVLQYVQAPQSTGFGFGLAATKAGLVLVPASLTMWFGSRMAAKLVTSIGTSRTMIAGAVIATLGMAILIVSHHHVADFVIWPMMVFGGNGLMSATAPILIMRDVSASQSGEATGVNSIVRYVGSSIGTQVGAGVLAASAAQHASYPTENGFRLAFLTMAVAGAMAIAVSLMLRPPAIENKGPTTCALD